jgi:hypothetical protein
MLKTGQNDRSRRPRRSQAAWLEEVRNWKRSGLTATAYAEQRGLHAGTLVGWASKVREQLEVAPQREARGSRRGGLQFVPVRVAEDARSSDAAVGHEKVEILLRNGRRVRVGAHFDGDALSRVLQIVECGARC